MFLGLVIAPVVMESSIILDLLGVGLIIGLSIFIKLTTPSKTDLSNLDHALATVLQALGERLQNLDDVAERISSSVPQVNLTNQNPLISIIEAFQTLKGQSQSLNAPPLMRDGEGRFDYGTKESKDEETQTETEVIID